MDMEITNRKQNRLGEYDYGLEGAYFVTLCTHNRARLFQMELPVGNGLCAVPQADTFETGTERRPFPTLANQIIHKWIKETDNKFPNITVDKYVVMPDHLHLIVTIRERHIGRSLPDVIGFFKTMTTNDYIRGVKRGHLPPFDRKIWQKSYYDHVIRNQRDYDEIWTYIDQNPVKWQMIHEKP